MSLPRKPKAVSNCLTIGTINVIISYRVCSLKRNSSSSSTAYCFSVLIISTSTSSFLWACWGSFLWKIRFSRIRHSWSESSYLFILNVYSTLGKITFRAEGLRACKSCKTSSQSFFLQALFWFITIVKPLIWYLFNEKGSSSSFWNPFARCVTEYLRSSGLDSSLNPIMLAMLCWKTDNMASRQGAMLASLSFWLMINWSRSALTSLLCFSCNLGRLEPYSLM